MRKVLSILLFFVVSIPAMALTFSLSDAGGGVMRIGYDLDQAAGEALQALTLTVVRESGDAYVAGPDAYSGIFNIFVDWVADIDNVYNEIGDGHPFAMLTPDVTNSQYEASFPTHSFALSMGYIDPITGSQAAISDDGHISVVFTGLTASSFRVELDAFRGGAVGDNLAVNTSGLGMAQISPIPEPMTLGLFGTGALLVVRRRR